MKIQIDSENKIIKVEGVVGLGELVKTLDKLLPKTSDLGYWKHFSLETNTVIYNWMNPIVFGPIEKPLDRPWNSPFEIICKSPSTCSVNADTILGTPHTLTNFEIN